MANLISSAAAVSGLLPSERQYLRAKETEADSYNRAVEGYNKALEDYRKSLILEGDNAQTYYLHQYGRNQPYTSLRIGGTDKQVDGRWTFRTTDPTLPTGAYIARQNPISSTPLEIAQRATFQGRDVGPRMWKDPTTGQTYGTGDVWDQPYFGGYAGNNYMIRDDSWKGGGWTLYKFADEPAAFNVAAPKINEAELKKYQEDAAKRAGRRKLALEVAADPSRFNLSMPSLFKDGGEVTIPEVEEEDSDNIASSGDVAKFIEGMTATVGGKSVDDQVPRPKPDFRPKMKMPPKGLGASSEITSKLAEQFGIKLPSMGENLGSSPIGKETKAKKGKNEDSAKAQLEALGLAYQLRARAAQDMARGFGRGTFTGSTFERPSLTRGPLTARRFAEGGEVTDQDFIDQMMVGTVPREQESPADVKASEMLRALGETARGAVGAQALEPGSEAYRTGQALSNMPGVGIAAGVARGARKVPGAIDDAKQMLLDLESKAPSTIRAYTGHTAEIVGPFNMERARKRADMGPALYATENTKYASKEAEKRVGKGILPEDTSPAVYPLDLYADQIMLLDKEYPAEIGKKLAKMSGKVSIPEGKTVSGETLLEQIRANFSKEQLPGVFKALGFKGSEFTPGGIEPGTGRSFAIYETLDTAKGAFNKRAFAEGGEVTMDDWIQQTMTGTPPTDQEPGAMGQAVRSGARQVYENLKESVVDPKAFHTRALGNVASRIKEDPEGFAMDFTGGGLGGVVKPRGGIFPVAGSGSRLDNYLSRINDQLRYADDRSPQEVEAISKFIQDKGRKYLTSVYGAADDPVREAFLSGRMPKLGADKIKFRDYLMNPARSGDDPIARQDFERFYDESLNISPRVVSKVARGDYQELEKLRNKAKEQMDKGFAQDQVPEELINRTYLEARDVESMFKDYSPDFEKNLARRMMNDEYPGLDRPTGPDDPTLLRAANEGEVYYDINTPSLDFMAPSNVASSIASINPDKLQNMSFAEALIQGTKNTKLHRDWQEVITQARDGKKIPKEMYEIGTQPVVKLGNDRWVAVTTGQAADLEGAAMHHSVGGYARKGGYGHGGLDALMSGKAQVFSLRGPDGRPRVTVEAEKLPDGRLDVTQVKGNFNGLPSEEDQILVAELLKELPVKRVRVESYTKDAAGEPLPDRVFVDYAGKFRLDLLRK
jgi:hypothetical protein